MITELIPNKIYFRGSPKPPFYTKTSCTKLNKDGTYATTEHRRYATISGAKSNWCATKEEAIQSYVDYYFEHFHNKDMSNKAEVYQNFAKDMREYAKIHHPEYYL